MDNKKPLGLKILLFYWSAAILVSTLLIVFIIVILSLPEDMKASVLKSGVYILKLSSQEALIAELEKQIISNIPEVVLLATLIIGLLKLKEWSRIGMVLFMGYSLLTPLSKLIVFVLSGTWRGIAPVGSIAAFISLYYLTRPQVKEHFK